MAILDVASTYGKDPRTLSDEELKSLIFTKQRTQSGTETYKADPRWQRQIAAEITQYQDELGRREGATNQQSQKQELDSILGQGIQSGADMEASNQISRKAFEDIFSNAKQGGINTINESFIPQRQQAIEEAGVTGMLRQPGLLSSILANIDSRKGNAVRDLSLGLEGQRAQGRLGQESDLFNRNQTQLNNQRTYNLSRAGLNQSGQQFQQGFGLQSQQLNDNRSRGLLDDIMKQYGMDQATELGKAEADAAYKINKKGHELDYLNAAFNGIGAITGLGSTFKKK